jgi:hypothetical protein
LTALDFKRLKPKDDVPLRNFASNLNVRRYTAGVHPKPASAWTKSMQVPLCPITSVVGMPGTSMAGRRIE